jgi:hypothetical protein
VISSTYPVLKSRMNSQPALIRRVSRLPRLLVGSDGATHNVPFVLAKILLNASDSRHAANQNPIQKLMKTPYLIPTIIISAFIPLPFAFGQGSLTPSGAPAPIMKSLDQIEARSPVDATHTPGSGTNLFVINQPGSYYLPGNVVVTSGNGIAITTNGVTLDLNGFTISSTNAASVNGVLLQNGGNVQDISILNGHIQGGVTFSGGFSGTGLQNGIIASTPFGANSRGIRVSGVTVTGCRTSGISLGASSSTMVDNCAVQVIQASGGAGITAGRVSDCSVDVCGGGGISCFVAANSSGTSVGSSPGIFARSANNCVGVSGNGTGLSAQVATGCWGESTGFGSTGAGISALTATGCYGTADNSSGAGVTADVAANCRGFSSAAPGINAGTINTCYGISGSSTSNAVNAVFIAANSYGLVGGGTGAGVSSIVVASSYGQSTGGPGVGCNTVIGSFGTSTGNNGIAGTVMQNCYGSSSGPSGTFGIEGFISSVCSGTTISAIHNINSF